MFDTHIRMPLKRSEFNTSIIFVLLFLLSFSNSIAQSNPQTSVKSDTMGNRDSPIITDADLEKDLIPLEQIIEIAMANSPYLKYENIVLDIRKNSVKLAKREWHNIVDFGGSYSRGDQQVLIGGNSQTNLLGGYRYGVNASIPLSEFTNRGPKIKIQKAELEGAMYRKQQAELSLRRQVIEEYHRLISAQKLLKIKTDGKENAELTYEMAEKQFREGSIQISEITRVNDSKVSAQIALQNEVTQYKIMFLSFEELIGVKMSTLRRVK